MLYLQLFHGRATLTEEMDDWGSVGPTFGPLSFVHTTYAGVLHLGSPEVPWATIGDLNVYGACVYYDGMYYGDWSVFGEDQLDATLRARIVEFEESKTRPPDIESED